MSPTLLYVGVCNATEEDCIGMYSQRHAYMQQKFTNRGDFE